MITFDEIEEAMNAIECGKYLQSTKNATDTRWDFRPFRQGRDTKGEVWALVMLAMQMDNSDVLKWLEKIGEVPEHLKQRILNRKELTQDEMFEAYCKTV